MGRNWLTPIVGVDEVGRGCLAGPVYAAAVSLRSKKVLKWVSDSKLIPPFERERIAPLIREHHFVGLGLATVEEIDRLNILQASFLAMRRALGQLTEVMGRPPGHVLVDGHLRIPDLRILQTPMIGGDARHKAIGAASIVAKVARDRFMSEQSEIYPQYFFERHKGYGSPLHRELIQKIGPCPLHRRSFGGVREFFEEGASS